MFTTDDGLAVTVRCSTLTRMSGRGSRAAASSDKAKPEADRLNARLAGWTYQIGSWKEKSLVPTMDDLKAEPEPAKRRSRAPEADKK